MLQDSSYSFIANGASDGLAFRAFDKGYDVFMGNFRGTSSLKHVQPDISAKDYWDYTLDDHGNYDIRAFIAEIRRTKQKEVGPATRPTLKCIFCREFAGWIQNASLLPFILHVREEKHSTFFGAAARANLVSLFFVCSHQCSVRSHTPPSAPPFLWLASNQLGHQGHVDITAVAHSMGAAATMIYLVNMLRGRKQHHLSRVVLMSPAGYHRRIPRLCKITGPIINRTLSNWTYTLSIPSQGARTAASRLMMDTVR